MPTLAEIREQYPQYQDLPDQALASALHSKFYSDIPRAEFDKKIGYSGPVSIGDVAGQAWQDIKAIPSKIMGAAKSVATLPQRAGEAVQQFDATGEYNPAPFMEAAMLASPLPVSMRAGERAIAGEAKARITVHPIIPSTQQTMDAATKGFETARGMDVRIDPRVLPTLGTMLERQLQERGILPEHAPTAYSTIERFKSPPESSFSTIGDLHNARQALGNAAGSITHPKDTLAGSMGRDLLDQYLSALPETSVMAGPAAAARDTLKDAIGNYAAASRAKDFDTRLGKAERASDRQVAGSLDSQIKSKAGQVLDNQTSLRGLNQAEKDQLELINSGNLPSNILRQLGRGGTGVIPASVHLGTALATGGASVVPQVAIGAALYGAKKGAERMTVSRANKLDEMLRARSPLAQSMQPTTRELTGGEQARRAALARSLMSEQFQQ